MRYGLLARISSKLAGMASQVAVGVLVTLAASSLLGNFRAPPSETPAAQVGKFTTRLPGGLDSNVIQSRPTPLPLLALEIFRPVAFAAAVDPTPAKTATPAPRPREIAAVLPPPRPRDFAMTSAPVSPAPAPAVAAEDAPRGLTLAAIAAPLASIQFGRLAPGRETLAGVVDKARSAVDWIVDVTIR
jgi:hypothetical protein